MKQVAETLRSALNAVAEVAPDWLRARTPPEWFERYGRRIIEDYRLPKGKESRQAYAALVGTDGLRFLADLVAPTAPPELRHLPPVELLRRIWIQKYVVIGNQVRLCNPKEMPTTTEQFESHHEPEARYGNKRRMSGISWTGQYY